MQIKNLFDPSRDIYRTIEKVITYNASQEARLKAEITEYIATDSIEEQLEKLLTKMQAAMDAGGENEIGVWVSGFYGSGKSSFTKYLGLALDQSVKIDGVPFIKYFQDRLKRPQTKALLSTVATKFPAAVILLDLASEMLAGATMEEVSTVLYYKVLQWAGYSRNLKVAALERKLKKDSRYKEFTDRIESEVGVAWRDVQNDTLVIDSLLPEIAHEMYPQLFKTPTAFTTETTDVIKFENERVEEMINIIRESSGKQHIIFIVDEVGQYVGSRQNLILNFDGLAKNLKNLGDGKVWIMSTAQQTLTEDDPRAALNSPELYKLKDRCPIQIDLESKDIKEICYRRLLGKSPDGERIIGELFDKHGQALRYNTKLQDAKFYDSDFDKDSFINLYPFLPAHFDILLHLLGALAKSTGGIGLRSAIKVIQDILIEGPDDRSPVADQPLGWLATTVTLYDALEKDIRRAFPSIHKALGKVPIRFLGSDVHEEVAKTVAVLQILGNMPITVQNISGLMQLAIDAPSRRDEVEQATKDLINDPMVPFSEKEGNLCFLSEKINEIDQQRAQIPLRTVETRRILNEALREVFSPPPSTKLQGTLSVTSGLKTITGSFVSPLAGEREIIQTMVELVDPSDYATVQTRVLDESRQKSSQNTVYLVSNTQKGIDEQVADIYRCQEIAQQHRTDPDQEIKQYCADQTRRANEIGGELQRLLKGCLAQGSFIFRGQTTAVTVLDPNVLEASKKHLAGVAAQVFDRYSEAPVRADTTLAEKFLRVGNLSAVTQVIDPMSLVQVTGGTPGIDANHVALMSIRDYIDRNGSADGKRLIDHFTGAPFGWSQDTLRYLIAGLLWAGEIKLKVSGREVTVIGQQAIDALRTNNAFKAVGVSLRREKPPMEVLARAAQRLAEITGETVFPLEDDISKCAMKTFPQLQQKFGPLAEKLESLDLPGVDTVGSVSQEITDVLSTDGSDAPQRLGGVESSFFEGLKWCSEVESSIIKNDLGSTIRELQSHRKEIESMPSTGAPGSLRDDLEEVFSLVAQRLAQVDFYKHSDYFASELTSIKTRTQKAAGEMAEQQKKTIKDAQQSLQRLSEWNELTQEEQQQTMSDLEGLVLDASPDLKGLKKLLSQEYVIASFAGELQKQIVENGRKRRLARLEEEKGKTGKLRRSLTFPRAISGDQSQQLDQLIKQLQEVREELSLHGDIEITITIED